MTILDKNEPKRMYLTKQERIDNGLDNPDGSRKDVVKYSPVDEIKNKTPVALKKHFIDRASPMIDQMIDAALGEGDLHASNVFAQAEVWDILKEVIKSAENPAPLIDLKGKSIEDQIDKILHKLTEGEINFTEAKEYMALVSQGFNLQKLPELLAKLNQLEDL